MKLVGCILVFLSILSVTRSFAQEPLSFRSQALGGVIMDDLDLVYDPVELGFVDGIRLYTNLSNLASSNEQILNDISENEYLFGVSFQHPYLKTLSSALLLRFSDAQTPNFVYIDSDLNGSQDMSGRGTLTSNYSSFDDANNDGEYDYQQNINQTFNDLDENNNLSFIFNNAYKLSENLVGLKVAYRSYEDQGIRSSASLGTGNNVLTSISSGAPTFNRTITTTDIIQNFVESDWSETGNFVTNYSLKLLNFQLALLLTDFRGYEIRFDMGYFNSNSENGINDRYHGMYAYYNDEISNYQNDYSENDRYVNETRNDGNGFEFGMSVRQTFDQKEQRKNDGYWKVGADLSFASYDYTFQQRDIFTSTTNYITDNPFVDYREETDRNLILSDLGDRSSNIYRLHGLMNYPLSSGVYFGIGGRIMMYSSSRETDYTEMYDNRIDHSDVDGESDYFDYVRTESEQLTADRKYEYTYFNFQAPVGLEYRFTESLKWGLRFGALFNYYQTETIDEKSIKNSEPYTQKVNRGDGSSSTSMSDDSYSSTKEKTETANSNTIFTYGLGYDASENLQIDLLGFFGSSDNGLLDAEFYRALRLSFTLRF